MPLRLLWDGMIAFIMRKEEIYIIYVVFQGEKLDFGIGPLQKIQVIDMGRCRAAPTI